MVLTVGEQNALDLNVAGGGNAGPLAPIAAREAGFFAYGVPSGSGPARGAVCGRTAGRTAARLIQAGS